MDLLREELVAHIGVATADGPYVTPVSFVYSGEDIAFRTRPGTRLSALTADPRVCVEVSRYDRETGAWESVVVRGHARRITDDQRIQQVIAAILGKYRQAFGSLLAPGAALPLGDEAVVVVGVEEITGRSSGSFFGPRTRPGRM